jgi:hypothetical protein
MELEQNEIVDKKINSLLNELHTNSNRLSSLLSDHELRTLLELENNTSVQTRRRSKPHLSISTVQPTIYLEPLDTNNTPKKCFISPYKCHATQQTPTTQMTTNPFNSQQQSSPLKSPYKQSLIPTYTPLSAVNSKERVEKTLQDALQSIHKQIAILDMTHEEEEHVKKLDFE